MIVDSKVTTNSLHVFQTCGKQHWVPNTEMEAKTVTDGDTQQQKEQIRPLGGGTQ